MCRNRSSLIAALPIHQIEPGGRIMRTVTMLTVTGALLLPLTAAAQEGHVEIHEFSQHLFPPELVMRHQRHLDLTDQQQSNIRQQVRDLQAQVLDLQWQLEDQQQALGELLAQETVDPDAALLQMDQVLQLESQIKRNHFRLLIEIKNQLTAEQRQKLQTVMEHMKQEQQRQHEMMQHLQYREQQEQTQHLERMKRGR
jgi:Spy/CpxP family protein refolding chaperone